MFEDSLFAAAEQDKPKRWTALFSFTMQSLVVATFLVLPMLFTDALPFHPLRAMVQLRSLPPSPTESVAQPRAFHGSAQEVLRVPRSVPLTIDRRSAAENILPDLGGNSGPPNLSDAAGSEGPLAISLLDATRAVTPVIQRIPHKSVRVSSGVEQGLLIQKVNPVYPALARSARVQGEVILQAVIGKNGRIENLHAVSGPPMLVKAALDAVQQWRYRPYMLNGEAVEVETQITVRFTTT